LLSPGARGFQSPAPRAAANGARLDEHDAVLEVAPASPDLQAPVPASLARACSTVIGHGHPATVIGHGHRPRSSATDPDHSRGHDCEFVHRCAAVTY
jgi:hypothetical protein